MLTVGNYNFAKILFGNMSKYSSSLYIAEEERCRQTAMKYSYMDEKDEREVLRFIQYQKILNEVLEMDKDVSSQ